MSMRDERNYGGIEGSVSLAYTVTSGAQEEERACVLGQGNKVTSGGLNKRTV